MYNRVFSMAIVAAALAAAQPIPQRAAMAGGGNPNAGQCTATVVVDGQVEIEIRGSDALMRDLGGAPPQWRRFECTSAMPANPSNFQFAGLNGRGHQNLVAEPRNGGPAVVRIEDPEGGAAEYTFRLAWSNNTGGQDRGPSNTRDDRGFQRDDHGFQGDRDQPGDRRPDMDAYHNDRDAFFRGNNGQAMMFQRVREDLDHATSGAFPFNGDRARLERTKMELDELQQKLARGFYDERELDESTAALQAVVEGNRLEPRDRAMLTDDLNRMHDFRARHDEYGAHFAPGGGGDRDNSRDGYRDSGRAMFFQSIREDLDRATSGVNLYRGERQRLSKAQYQLNDLQTKMAQRVYDEREFNEVMDAMQGFVDSNRLASRDRGILSEDIKRLDDFRVRHQGYGSR